MPCLIGMSALFFPRIILILVWLLGNGWLQASFQTVLIPVLGFLLLPLTTLAWAGSRAVTKRIRPRALLA